MTGTADAPPSNNGRALTEQAAASIDDTLARARVLVMAGPGGVGKTTIAAALGLRAAQVNHRRVIVVTVDPARRLAEALGVDRLTEEPVLVPVGSGDGRLWMLMVDMAKSWDDLVKRHAPDPASGRRLLANELYRTLTRRFVQSHDYIALDHLVALSEQDRYDLVVVDTPPSGHVLDLLDAPDRMIDFFESRLLRWLTASAGSGLAAVAAKPFLLVAERLLGHDFLRQITEFFGLFAQLRPAFVARAHAVRDRLADEATTYVVVTTTDSVVAGAAQELIDELERRELVPGLLVVNRFVPTLRMTAEGTIEPRFDSDDFSGIENSSLRDSLSQLIEQASEAQLPDVGGGCPVVAVPWSADDLADLDGLARLLSPAEGGSHRNSPPHGSTQNVTPA